jgi:hypothetical protein
MDIQQEAITKFIFPISTERSALQLREDFNVSPEQRALVIELDAFEAPYLRETLIRKGVFESEGAYTSAFIEFKKFVVLNKLFGGDIVMASPDVDSVWHHFILFTRQYFAFCEQFLGHYLHHQPTTSSVPREDGGRERFKSLYNRVFGDPPAIWSCEERCSSCRACKS